MLKIPAGSFEMGIMAVLLTKSIRAMRSGSFESGWICFISESTMSQRAEYCEFLNSAFAKTQHRRPNGRGVPGAGNDLFFDARASSLSGR